MQASYELTLLIYLSKQKYVAGRTLLNGLFLNSQSTFTFIDDILGLIVRRRLIQRRLIGLKGTVSRLS